MTDKLEYIVRPYELMDRAFVCSSWKNTLIDSTPLKKDKAAFFAKYNPRVSRLLDNCRTLVACDEQEQDLILGWACVGERRDLHYVYVRGEYRQMGMCNRLLKEAGMPLSHTEPLICSDFTDTWADIAIQKKYMCIHRDTMATPYTRRGRYYAAQARSA